MSDHQFTGSDQDQNPQLALSFDDPDDAGVTLTEKFERFHNRNPRFYAELVTLARRFKNRTGRTCGIQRLIEIARFDIEMTTDSEDEFKVNNNYAAFYARLIMNQERDLAGFFNLRRSVEADTWADTLGQVA